MTGKTEMLQNLIGSAAEQHPDLLNGINLLSGGFADKALPWLDRESVEDAVLSQVAQTWRTDGVLCLMISLISTKMHGFNTTVLTMTGQWGIPVSVHITKYLA